MPNPVSAISSGIGLITGKSKSDSEEKPSLGSSIAQGVGNIAGAYISSKYQKDAAKIAAAGAENAGQLIYQQFKDTEANLKPFITGQGGPKSFQMQQALSGALGADAQKEAYANYVESPGVDFLRERGMRGIEQNAAAAGSLYSGNTLKALSDFNKGLALQDFNNFYNRLGSLTGVSLGAAQALGGVGGAAATGQAQMTYLGSQELGAGKIGRANTYQSAFSDLGGTLGNVYEAWKSRG